MKKVLILLSFLLSNPLSSLAPNSCMINPFKALDSSTLVPIPYKSISDVNSFRRHLLFLLLDSAHRSLDTPNFFYPTSDQEDNPLMLTSLFLKQSRSFLIKESSKQRKKIPTRALLGLNSDLERSKLTFEKETVTLDNFILSLYILDNNPETLSTEECEEFLSDLIGLSEKYLKYTYIPTPYKEFFNLLSQTNHETISLAEVFNLAKQSSLFIKTDDTETDDTETDDTETDDTETDDTETDDTEPDNRPTPLAEDHNFTIRAKNQIFYQLTLDHSFFKKTWSQVFESKKDKEELEKIRSEKMNELREQIENLKQELKHMSEELKKGKEKELYNKELKEKKLNLCSLKEDLLQKELSDMRSIESRKKALRENIEKARKDLEDCKKIANDKKNANLQIIESHKDTLKEKVLERYEGKDLANQEALDKSFETFCSKLLSNAGSDAGSNKRSEQDLTDFYSEVDSAEARSLSEDSFLKSQISTTIYSFRTKVLGLLGLQEREDKTLKEKETFINHLEEDLSNVKEIEKQKREEEEQILSLYNELSKSDFYSNLMNSILEKNS